jgi:uncharacterized membrane protein YozB (DUF420 family)
MEHFQLHKKSASAMIVTISRYAVIAAIGFFVTYVSFRAIEESWNNEGFPEALAIKLELMPIIFPVHMVTGGLTLLLVPLAIYLRYTSWHKIAGRIAALDIAVSGITAIPVALAYPVTPISGLGFAAQAITWMMLLGLGIWHIKDGRIKQHRACMLMLAAVTSGAIFFRVYLGLWKLLGSGKYFYTFYAIDAWIAWSLPLIAMSFYVRKTK